VDLGYGVGASERRRPPSWDFKGAEERLLGPEEDGMTDPIGTEPMNLGDPIATRRTQPDDRVGSGDHFAAPLGSSRSGRLRFTNSAHQVTIRADSYMRSLYRAHFMDRMPMVGVQGGVVTIRFPRVPACDWLGHRSERPAEVALNARIPWDVDVRGGASRFTADLCGLRLGSLRVDGGASHFEVTLPAPSGTVPVFILGGASNGAIRRLNGVAARLRVGGGATQLKFDGRRIVATGGELDLRDHDYDGAVDRYDLVVTGGANNVSIDKQ